MSAYPGTRPTFHLSALTSPRDTAHPANHRHPPPCIDHRQKMGGMGGVGLPFGMTPPRARMAITTEQAASKIQTRFRKRKRLRALEEAAAKAAAAEEGGASTEEGGAVGGADASAPRQLPVAGAGVTGAGAAEVKELAAMLKSFVARPHLRVDLQYAPTHLQYAPTALPAPTGTRPSTDFQF